MSNVKVELNSQGVKAMLQSDYMLSMVKSVAKDEAKANTHIKSFIGYNRAKAIIYPNTKEHQS